MHHYQHHIGDYDAATAHLSWDEDMAYTRLLRVYYRDESKLPKNIEDVCRLVRARSKRERQAVISVLKEFFELTEDGWLNERAEIELAKFREKSLKAKDSANARWRRCERNALAMLTANREPLIPPLPPKGGTASPGISRDALTDPDKLRRWCARTGKRLGLTPADLTWIVAAADKALEVGDDPVGLFLFLAGEVAAGRTDKIGDDRYDAAKRKLRDRSIAEDLAEAKGVDFDEQ